MHAASYKYVESKHEDKHNVVIFRKVSGYSSAGVVSVRNDTAVVRSAGAG